MNILIRTDASENIGSGHLMRCLTLADQLRDAGNEVTFACRDLIGGMFDLINDRGYRSAKLSLTEAKNDQQQVDAKETIKIATELFHVGVDWLIVDHYDLDSTWECLLRPYIKRIMVIDDLADRQHECDILLDQNYYRNLDKRYQGLVPESCITLLGPSHLLLRPEFTKAMKKLKAKDGTIKRILVFFGGSDIFNHTQKIIEALKILQRPDIEVDVVVGSVNPQRKKIQALCNGLSNVTYHCQVSNMAELILNADLGIGAGGSAMWERCCLGLPTITTVFAENQARTTEDVAEIGAIEYLGWADQLSVEDYERAIARMIKDPLRVKDITSTAFKLIPQEISTFLLDTMKSLFLKSEINNMTSHTFKPIDL